MQLCKKKFNNFPSTKQEHFIKSKLLRYQLFANKKNCIQI